ncbi:hypothetical protein KSF78_0009421 [Schistosoma japonicum]|nr:hypothetical protein KSF78_0009421 [Schistosoma japonicum]KAH8857114.1 hypothetical protein KSF78_0009421 [Schistosoma japonicum]
MYFVDSVTRIVLGLCCGISPSDPGSQK